MFQRNQLNVAILAVMFGTATTASAAMEEVVVTATKRSVSMQDVPLAVQAMSSRQLEEQNIQEFSDYIQYLPNVNAGGRGPGQSEIYIRGAAVDAINITVAESQGSAPNVALYLDEQPVTAGGRNLDVYISDMERIEVLPGPQGTLYGASSMAGTIRLITNKPVIDEVQASMNGSWSSTKGGEASNSAELMLNLPVIEGKMAVRLALYNDSQGGYIDNVEGTFQADNAVNPTFPGETVTFAPGTVFANGDVVGAGGLVVPVSKTVASNSALVEDDFNDASYAGFRAGLKYLINDDWSLLVQHAQQSLKTEGVFDYDPSIGDLQVTRFAEDKLSDDFNQTSWTLDGRVGALDLVYTGAFLDREVVANIDYTGYTNVGGFISGYQCEYLVGSFYTGLPSAADGGPTTTYSWDPTLSGNTGVIECGNPSNAAHIENQNTRWTHEFRVTTNFDSSVNLTAGVFYEDFEIEHVGDFNYQAPIDAGFAPIDINSNSTFDNSTANARGKTTLATQFRNDNTRTETQAAIFGELSWDVTSDFNLAAGARYYDLEYAYKGYGAWRYGNRPLFTDDADPTNDIRPTRTGGRDYEANFAELQPISVDDTIVKFTASWTPNDDTLIYASWSEGYRPPGFNRAAAKEGGQYNSSDNNLLADGTNCGTAAPIEANAATGFPGYCLPYVFESDTLENMELGWKTTMADGQVRFNGAIYKIDWNDIQVSQFDSQNISVLTIVDNGGDAEILGVEADLVWLATDNFTLYAAASYNDTELVRVDPAFAVIVADEGSPLPLTPEFQSSIRGRYEWQMAGALNAHWQLGIKYAGEALNSLVDTPTEPNSTQQAYTLVNASVGVQDESVGWGVELFVSNLTDKRAELHINRQDFFERITTNRPRTIGLRVSYDLR
ncbi:TonB-dependent receptor [Pseudomonadales bacterium]|nr:TonB-dependent receptor [Pseudomonadales bacterium]MDA9297411.1 TonB-dependent receptor [Pseudomonadales bacterium]MDB9867729.1 TonB-dependent receptor [Pseudomonadales bacterium]MDB9917420.1 TonB-dependent receptor [Pseudomonadales bacterium]MDC1307398.1 TonB-dependent receptor [Pseudomonadales bacterium]